MRKCILLLALTVGSYWGLYSQTDPPEPTNSPEKTTRLFFGRPDKLSLYMNTQILSLGGFFENDFRLGLGVEQVVGHHWNQFLNTGIGIGANNYDLQDRLLVIPLFIEARGALLDYKVTPHYALGVGYGFANADSDNGITEAKGGYMLHPALGITLGSGKRAQFHLEAGYRFQRVRYTKEYIWSNSIDKIDILYRRFLVRLGVQFNFYVKD